MNPVGEIAGFPLYAPDAPFEAVQTALEARELGDGLPLVPPTPERLERMLAPVRDRDASAGPMPPLMGELRVDAVAYQCVLAGCHATELALVWSAARACLAPPLNLLGVLTTTGTPAIAMLVHEPAASHYALNAGSNCLGPGHRTNACIGRALSLVFLNIGGARAGVGDMATMGQPGKYGFCFGAHDHPLGSPLAKASVDADGMQAVTVLAVSGTTEVLPRSDERTPSDILDPMAMAMRCATRVSGGGRTRAVPEHIVLLPPELADRLIGLEWSLEDVRGHLFGAATGAAAPSRPDSSADTTSAASRIHPVITGGPGVKMTCVAPWSGGSESVTVAIRNP